MKYLALVVIFGLFQGVVLAGPASVAPATASALEDVISRAQVALGNMTAEVSKVLGVTDITDGQKVLNSLIAGTENLAKKVGSIVSDLQKEVSTHSDINGILRSVRNRLNQTLLDLQTPEIQAKAVQVQHQLENGLQTLIAESRKLANAAVSDLSNSQSEITKITKKALEDVIETASKVQEKVKAVIANAAPST